LRESWMRSFSRLGQDVGEEAFGLAPFDAGEVLEGGSCGDEDGVDFVLAHELAGQVEAGVALVVGDGGDVFGAVFEGEDGGWEVFGGCGGFLLGLQG